jgi:stress-induced morphogen
LRLTQQFQASRPFTTTQLRPSEEAGRSPASIPTSSLALQPPSGASPAELQIFTTLASELQPTELEVEDISGGCGSMFAINITAEAFRGLGMLKQQRLVNGLLKGQMDREGWHGVRVACRVPE